MKILMPTAKLLTPTANLLKEIADKKYTLTTTMKRDILKKMTESAESGCYHLTMSFSDREECLIPQIKLWLEGLGYKCYVNNRCLMRISWEDARNGRA